MESHCYYQFGCNGQNRAFLASLIRPGHTNGCSKPTGILHSEELSLQDICEFCSLLVTLLFSTRKKININRWWNVILFFPLLSVPNFCDLLVLPHESFIENKVQSAKSSSSEQFGAETLSDTNKNQSRKHIQLNAKGREGNGSLGDVQLYQREVKALPNDLLLRTLTPTNYSLKALYGTKRGHVFDCWLTNNTSLFLYQ